MNKDSKQIKVGAILSYLQIGLSIIIGLLYTPAMIRLLGQNEFGLYNTVASTTSMLSVMSLGLNAGYIKFYSKYKKENDSQSINKLNGMFLAIFLVLGIISFLCGLFLSFNLNIVFNNGLTESEYITAKVLMILMTIGLSTSFPLSVFTNIITASENFIFLKSLNIIQTVLTPLVTLPLLLMGHKSVSIVTISLTLQTITGFLNIWFTVFKLKHRFTFRGIDSTAFIDLFGYTVFIAINIIIDQINWKTDQIILGRYCGTACVAVYSVGSTLNNYYIMFSSSISGFFTPRIHRIVNELNDSKKMMEEKLSELFIRIGRIQFLVLMIIATGFIFFGKSFISLWAGTKYEKSYYVALILIIPVTVPLIQNIGIEIQRALNKHKFRSIVYLAMAFINLLISIILCKKYSEIGVAFGTGLSLLIANGIIMNIYYYRKCGINILLFWYNIIKMSLGLIPPVFLAVLFTSYYKIDTIIKLLIGIIIYTFVYSSSMWFISMNKYEKELVLNTIKKLRN